MEGMNKLISLFLGLVVVIIFFGVITGRINLKNKLPKLSKTTTVTPTPQTTTIKVTSESQQSNYYQKPTLIPARKYSQVTAIPSTGSPTILLPLAFFSLIVGRKLRKF